METEQHSTSLQPSEPITEHTSELPSPLPSSSNTSSLDLLHIDTAKRSDRRRQTILPGTILDLRKLSAVPEHTTTVSDTSPPRLDTSPSGAVDAAVEELFTEADPLSRVEKDLSRHALAEPTASQTETDFCSHPTEESTWSGKGRLRAKKAVVYASTKAKQPPRQKRSDYKEPAEAPSPKAVKLREDSAVPKSILKKICEESEAGVSSKEARHLAFSDESAAVRQQLAESRKVEVESSPAVLPNPPPKVTLLAGKAPNLQILSYNIGCLSTFLSKNTWVEINALLPDIICLQETKTEGEELLQLGVNVGTIYAYWNHGKSKNEAGVAVLSKNQPLNVLYGFPRSNGEEFAAMGHVITAEYPAFFVINTYVPSSATNLRNLQDRLLWEADFRSFVTTLQNKKPVIIAGDLNVAVQDVDIFKPSARKVPGSTVEERNSVNATLNSLGLVDVYRAVNPTVAECYTFFAPRSNAKKTGSAWRLDYFLISQRILLQVCGIHHFANIGGSTHIPIMLYLEIV